MRLSLNLLRFVSNASKCPLVAPRTFLLPKKFSKKIFCTMVERASSALHDYQHLSSLFQEVGESANENCDYFLQKQRQNEQSDFKKSFQTILHVLDPLQICLEVVTSCCSKFDVSPNCKGNGYRSIINIVESCLTKILNLSKQIQSSREKLFFRSYHNYMELESYTQVLTRLLTVVHITIVLLDYSDVGDLFPHEQIVEEVMLDFEKISRECFYGRSFGFQYSDSIRQSMQVVAVAMAAYGDGYMRHNHSFARALSSMLHSGKYMVDPELRAKRITELTQKADIDFCKAFWSLTEEHGVQHAPLLMCPAMAVNLEFTIPTESQTVTTLDGEVLTVDFPYLNSEQKGVRARLLSYVWREGQMLDESSATKTMTALGPRPSPKSRYLMFHCHGGGFVAQSSKSHEMYLRYWAKELKIPILSIDYSLAPDAPYPQALNEVYFAYVWALNNLQKLGTTAEKIVFSGDSAGANLVTSLSLRSIESNIRLADSIVVAYPPFRLQFIPSPSRILCLMDPLLPFGVLKSCIQAYCGSLKSTEKPKRLNSITHDSSYNAFDVDMGNDGWEPFNRFQLDHTHSFSESNLNTIKSRLFLKHQVLEEDQESFYSEFPYSDTEEESSITEGENSSLKDFEGEDYITFNADVVETSLGEGDIESVVKTPTNSNPSSLFSSLTGQMTSKVQNLTSGMQNFLYGKNTNETLSSETSSQKNISDAVNDITTIVKQEIDQKNTSTEIENNTSTDVSSRKRSLDNTSTDVLPKQPFKLCRECFHRSESCICNRQSTRKPRYDSFRSKTNHHRSSHHHKNQSYKQTRNRSKSLSRDIEALLDGKLELKRSTSICDTELSRQSSSEEESGAAKNSKTQSKKLTMSLNLDHVDSCRNTPRVSSPIESPPGSPRVVYDKDTESCVILTATEDENNFTDTTTPMAEDLDLLQKGYEEGKEPFMSPCLADDETLKKLPPMTVVACSLDPLLDDSVSFVKKLQSIGNEADLYILDRLPHGFLNFQVFSNEAREGCDLLVACIKKSLSMGMRRQDSSTSIASKQNSSFTVKTPPKK